MIQRCRRATGAALLALSAAGGCSDRPTSGSVDTLTLSGAPTELQRTDLDYLSEPLAVAMGPTSTFVSDAASGTVLEYARSGAFTRRIGSRGNGPGQFVGPTAMAIASDTLLLVGDAALRRVSVFSLTTGALVGAYRLPSQATNLAVRRDTIVMGMQDVAQSTSVGVLVMHDSAVRAMGPVPSVLRLYPRIAEAYPLAWAVRSGEAIRVAFMGTDVLYTLDALGALRDSTRIPARQRVGVPNDLDARLGNPEARGNEAAPASVLSFVGALSDGSTVLVHTDFAMVGGAVGVQTWLSRVDAAGRVVCHDAVVPAATDARAVFALDGDTLVVVQHRARPVTGVMATTLSRYRLPRC